jgi:hypothetical protein
LRPRRLALLLLACLPLAACGKEEEPAPRVLKVKAPKGERTEDFPEAGITIVRPRNWRLHQREQPGVFELRSGEATVAAWAYPREEDLPESAEQLESARERLVGAIEERDPEFELASSETTEVAGSPAIDVLGDQVIAKRRLRTHSVHVFVGEVEYVFEAIAPPADHELTDARVLGPLLESVELEGEVREDSEG